MCPDCGAYTSIPSARPIPCNVSWCYRKNLDPNHLTQGQKFLYMTLDDQCDADCPIEHCGLLSRLAWCGQSRPIREYCYCSDTDEDSESDQESGIDSPSPQPTSCAL